MTHERRTLTEDEPPHYVPNDFWVHENTTGILSCDGYAYLYGLHAMNEVRFHLLNTVLPEYTMASQRRGELGAAPLMNAATAQVQAVASLPAFHRWIATEPQHANSLEQLICGPLRPWTVAVSQLATVDTIPIDVWSVTLLVDTQDKSVLEHAVERLQARWLPIQQRLRQWKHSTTVPYVLRIGGEELTTTTLRIVLKALRTCVFEIDLLGNPALRIPDLTKVLEEFPTPHLRVIALKDKHAMAISFESLLAAAPSVEYIYLVGAEFPRGTSFWRTDVDLSTLTLPFRRRAKGSETRILVLKQPKGLTHAQYRKLLHAWKSEHPEGHLLIQDTGNVHPSSDTVYWTARITEPESTLPPQALYAPIEDYTKAYHTGVAHLHV